MPSALTVSTSDYLAVLTLSSAAFTIGDMLDKLGLDEGDYITVVGLGLDTPLVYARYYVKSGLVRTTSLSTATLASIFDVETNDMDGGAIDTTNYKVKLGVLGAQVATGVILSKKTDNGWEHTDSELVCTASQDYAENAALPTYPVGSAEFLNGGDIF